MTNSKHDRRAFDELLTFIEEEVGFSTSMYNDRYLDRRIAARMRRTDADTYSEYHAALRDDPTEEAALVDTLSINVTEFFRNEEMWRRLPDLLEDLADRSYGTVRLWSAACSDGREPYSMALLVHSVDGLDPSRFEIVATDIKPSVLETARSGVYPRSGTDDAVEELSKMDGLEPYFDIDEDRLEVAEAVRDTVTFRRHDLIRDHPPTDFDLVMCRNLLIYINSESKRELFETLTNGLNEEGYLVIGKTETLPAALADEFETVDSRRRIYQRGPES